MDEDYISGMGGLHLGSMVGDRYVTNVETASILNKINSRLHQEDQTHQTYRKQLDFAQLVRADLIPILLNGSADLEVYAATVRLLVNLLVPIECLFPNSGNAGHNKNMASTRQLSLALSKTKEIFRDEGPTEAVLQFLGSVSSSSAANNKALSVPEIATINNSLLLLRNVLHIPENPRRHKDSMCSTQNMIIWNLFKQNIDKVLSDLTGHMHAREWASAIVQLVALLYKDQHVLSLQSRLKAYLESTIGESSEEDYESNTSPQQERENESPDSNCRTNEGTNEESSSDHGEELRGQSQTNKNKNKNKVKTCKKSSSDVQSQTSSGLGRSRSDLSSHPSKDSLNNTIEPKVSEGPPLKKLKSDSGKALVPTITTLTTTTTTADSAATATVAAAAAAAAAVNATERKEKNSSPELKSSEEASPNKFVEGLNLTSSDNSDITGNPIKNKASLQGYATDNGYLTQLFETKTPEFSSTEEDNQPRVPRPQPVKLKPKMEPMHPQQKRKQRLLWLFNYGQEKRMRLKAMVNHIPSQEDITEILVDFTIDFLITAFGKLVGALLGDDGGIHNDLEKSHFLWLVSYFLKISYLLDLDLDQLDQVFSFKAIALITYEGLEQLESLELANRERLADINPHIGRMHLVVTAVKEFLQAIACYKRNLHLTEEEKAQLNILQHQIASSGSLRQLLLLLIRSYNPGIQSLQYLGDLVLCNHMMLVNLEEVDHDLHESVKLSEHLKQFATSEVMRQYGRLLTDFYSNNTAVNEELISLNDSIFTMMHHVAGDLNASHTLYLPTILHTFSRILEENVVLCDDWIDLIEYIIQQFIQKMSRSPHECAETMAGCMDAMDILNMKGLTVTQTNQLWHHFSKVENSNDPVADLIEIYRQTDNLSLSRLSVIQSLLTHGIITHAQYMNFMYMKGVMDMHTIEKEESVLAEAGSEHCVSDGHLTDTEEADHAAISHEPAYIREIEVLKECLKKQGQGSLITWVQDVLIDICRVKIYPVSVYGDGGSSVWTPNEPIPFHYNLTKQNIPLVPFNLVQSQGLQTEAFILLLHKLGILLPADVGKVYPRIPHFWSADHLLTVANKLGPVSSFKLTEKDIKLINVANNEMTINGNNSPDKEPAATPMLVDDEVEATHHQHHLAPASRSSPRQAATDWIHMSMASKTMTMGPASPSTQTPVAVKDHSFQKPESLDKKRRKSIIEDEMMDQT